jgi:hypothetical protein
VKVNAETVGKTSHVEVRKDGDLMRTDQVRFTMSQWALVGVILFYTLGTTMIARHTKRIFKPASAGGNERISTDRTEQSDQQKLLVRADSQRNNSDLKQWDGSVSDLTTLYDVAFGAAYLCEDDNSESAADPNEEEKEKEQELTKIRTKLKCVEKVLKKADIEPYCVDGETKGLKLNGLDDLAEAKELQINSGDVILAVNGLSLGSKKEAYEIFIEARKEPIMIIDLLQDGESKKLLLDFE